MVYIVYSIYYFINLYFVQTDSKKLSKKKIYMQTWIRMYNIYYRAYYTVYSNQKLLPNNYAQMISDKRD